MKMGTRRSGIVQEREDSFLKRLLATWPPELPTRFAGLGFSSRVPGAPWRRAPGRLRRDTPCLGGAVLFFPAPPGDTRAPARPLAPRYLRGNRLGGW